MKHILIVISFLMLLSSCEKDSTASVISSTSNECSVSGMIIDRASDKGLVGGSVKIVNKQNEYRTSIGGDGSFSFQNIQDGDYKMISIASQNGLEIVDTCGSYNTNITNWGVIYSDIFISITGAVRLEGEADNSLINVQLLGSDKSALTTNTGKFRIDFVLPGEYDLSISASKNNHKKILIKDIIVRQGDVLKIDTTLTYRFKPLVIEKTNNFFLRSDGKISQFCFADGYFWYTHKYGLLKNNPKYNLEDSVFKHNQFYLGNPKITYDNNDGLWLSADEPRDWYYRKYSFSKYYITDSVRVSSLPSHKPFCITSDVTGRMLILFDYTSFNPKIYKYDLLSRTYETIVLKLEEYEFDNYKSIDIDDIYIDKNGKVYFVLIAKNLNNIIESHLYVCNNLAELKLIRIYKFPDNNRNRLSFYNNEIYTYDDFNLYKLVF